MDIEAFVVEQVDAPFRREQLELESPGEGELLVRVVASGVCHTDAIAQHGDMPLPLPAILGHEGSGVVEEAGPGVTTVAVGDRVVMGWPFCGQCRNCLRGEPRYCDLLGPAVLAGTRFVGPQAGSSAYKRPDGTAISGHFFGQSSFATYSITNANSVVKVPDGVPLELMGPLACGLATGAGAVLNSARPEPGESIVVVGAGAVGLAAVMAARNTPATKIIAADLNDSRLQLATKYGATHTINTGQSDLVEAVHEICGGPADYVLECTGVISVLEKAAEAVGMLGTVLLIGGAPAGASFSLDHLSALWGKRVIGTLGGSSTSNRLIPTLIELYQQGRFPFDELVRFYDFDQVGTAIADSTSGDTVKPVLRISAE